MSSAKLSETFLSPAFVAGVAALATYFAGYDANVNTPIDGVSLPLPIYVGALSFLSSLSGQTIKQYLLPMSLSNSDSTAISALTMPVIVGASDALMVYLLSGQFAMQSFLIGAGSQLAGSYMYDNLVKQYISPSYM